MTNLHSDTFNVFEYAETAKTIGHMWWTSGPVHGVGPNLLAMAVGCKSWTYSHIKPLLDSAKSIAPQTISEPLKHGTHRWNRMIVVDGISVYMGVLLFDKVCKEYGLTTDSKTTDMSFHGITEEQIDRAAKNYRKKQLAMINRDSRNTWKLEDPERHFVAWVEEDDAFKAGVQWALNQLSQGK